MQSTTHSSRGARTTSEHPGEEAKGWLKEAIGDPTGDKSLQREGRIDQASAATKKKIGEAADRIKDAVNPKG